MLREQVKLINFTARTVDLAVTAGCFIGAYFLRTAEPFAALMKSLAGVEHIGPLNRYLWALFIIVPLWAVILHGFGMYDSMRTKSYFRVSWTTAKSVAAGFIILTVLVYFLDKSFSRSLVVFFAVINLAVLLIEKTTLRFLQRYFRSRGFNYRYFVIVGSSERARRLGEQIENHAGWGLRFVGYVRAGGKEQEPLSPCLGDVENMAEILDDNVIDEVFFHVPYESLDAVKDAVTACDEVGVKVHISAEFLKVLLSRTTVDDFHGLPVLSSSSTHDKAGFIGKRTLDFIASLLAILILSPLFLSTALILKLTSRGPVLVREPRYGRNRKIFNQLRFRTHKVRDSKYDEEIESMNEKSAPVFRLNARAERTRFGRILEKFSIDRIPQFLNVLKGEMSLVGPRPLPVYEVDQFARPWERRRLSMKPGMASLWNGNGRILPDPEESLKLDLEYVDNWSMGLDVKILLKSIPSVIFSRDSS